MSKRANLYVCLTVSIFLLWVGGPTQAATITVRGDGSGDHSTIQAGIDAATTGDTVIVAPGTYGENVNFGGKNIILRSTDPLDPSVVESTIIDGNQFGAVVTFLGTEGQTCVLSGFTIRNGKGHVGGGIEGRGAHARIEHNVVASNSAYVGGGLADCHGTIQNNTISKNSSISDGGGLSGCDGTIQNNIISGNATNEDGGGLDDCDSTIQNNTIFENSASDEGGGLSGCDGAIQNNTVVGNSAATTGGGLNGCLGTIRNCIIWANKADISGNQIDQSNTASFSCIENWSDGGMGNVTSEPLFVDEAADDYHLQNSSPCIDAGIDYYWFAWPQRDLDGNCRVAGLQIDMGCYEHGSLADRDGDLLSDPDETAAETDPDNHDTDGDRLRDGLEIMRGSNPLAATPPRTVYVPSDIPTIQQSLCLAVNGEEIVVRPGTYQENSHFCGADVTLRSQAPESPPKVASTILDGGGAGPVVCFTGSEGQACVLAGFTVQNGTGDHGGGVRGGTSLSHTHATIRNNVISGNSVSRGGGGIAWCDGTIRNNNITENSARSDGGGISQCHGTIQDNIISGNSVNDDGGGVAHCHGTVLNNTITGNSAGDSGGGLANCDGTVRNNTITGNSGWDGGGLANCDGMVRDNTVTENEAVGIRPEGDGGGLVSCDATIQDNTIENNTARDGGGLANCDGPVRRNIVTHNLADDDGGGVAFCDGTVENNTISENHAEDGGGGIWKCDGTIRSNTITGNSAGSDGGGLSKCEAVVQDNTVVMNSAWEGGGLAYCSGTVQKNTISENSAWEGGGLAYCSGTVQNNTITGNSAENAGGGVGSCDGTIQNNMITGNTAAYGGGLAFCNGTIQNNTITANRADEGSGGLAYCNGAIRNCIIWGNSEAQIFESTYPSFSCIQSWSGGGRGNVASNPLFVDEEADDYHLRSSSPCIDAGINFYWFAWPQRDIDGNCRLTGARVDMGCYEHDSSADRDGDLLSDLDEPTTKTDPNNEDTDGDGLCDGLELLRGSDPCAETIAGTILVPADVPTIQEALCVAVSGETIVVAGGIYRENLHFCDTEVILRSSNPENPVTVASTILDGDGLGPVVSFTGSQSSAGTLAGFTILNGRAACGGGICGGTRDNHSHVTIRNNTITGNLAVWSPSEGAGGGVAFCDGMIRNSTITGNFAYVGGGLANCHGTIQNNTISKNSSISDGGGLAFCDGTIQNNTITANLARDDGGGLAFCNGMVQNNMILENSANNDGGGLAYCDGTIQNNTITANLARDDGGGLVDCYGKIRNCIIWANTADDTADQIVGATCPSFSCIQDWSGSGTENIGTNPLFVNPTTGDYHLKTGSPCIDAGANYYWFAWPQHDLDGSCRLVGSRVDMGCYEYGARPDSDGDLLSDADELTRETDPLSQDTDGDGLRDGLEILRQSDPLIVTAPGIIRVPVDIPTIQVALSLALAGEEIFVLPGIYHENLQFCGVEVVLRSSQPENPAIVAQTILDGGGAGPVVSFTGSDSGACILSGFTIQNGHAGYGGGICGGTSNQRTHGTIRNNVITGNSAARDGGGLAFCDGTVSTNRITANSADLEGGGLAFCDGTVSNNTITANLSGDDGGGLSRCDGMILSNMVAGNSAGDDGGGMAHCRAQIENNTIVGNTAYGTKKGWGGGLFKCLGPISNCIVWKNTASTGDSQISNCAIPNYSCIQEWTGEGTANVNLDPLFRDPNGLDNDPNTHEDNNYRLLLGSPCIDTGANADWMPNAVDLDGNRRILNGTVDMGAYEFTVQGIPGDIDPDDRPELYYQDRNTKEFILIGKGNRPDLSGTENRPKISISFNRAELMDAVYGYGEFKLRVEGKLKTGQPYFGEDIIHITRFAGD